MKIKIITENNIKYKVETNKEGTKSWYLNGKLHREDGPAVEFADGAKCWYRHGKLHREGGPALECTNGDKFWYYDGMCHREDGPAVELASGYKDWCLNDKSLPVTSNKQFLRLMNLKAFI